MTIRGSIVSGLDLLLGRDPADLNKSAIGPGTAHASSGEITIRSVILSRVMFQTMLSSAIERGPS